MRTSKAISPTRRAITSYRGAGRPEAIYVTERLIDAAAAAFGIDRLEIRRRNLIAPERAALPQLARPLDRLRRFSGQSRRCAQRADWAGFAAAPRAKRKRRGKKRGLGIAYYFEASAARRRRARRSSVHARWRRRSLSRDAVERAGPRDDVRADRRRPLGVPFEQVTIKQGDTDFGVAGGGTVGSRSAQTAGNAIGVAVEGIVRKGKTAAAQVLQAGGAPVEFEVEDGIGQFRVAGTAALDRRQRARRRR